MTEISATIADGFIHYFQEFRDRELEFREVQNGCKDEALAKMDDAVATVIQSLGHQTDVDWSLEYNADGVDDVHDRFSIYLRCSNHFHHHIGQMIYLVKAWSNAHHILAFDRGQSTLVLHQST